MNFHSISYLAFVAVAVLGYYLTSPRWRWAVLLAASSAFYAYWSVQFLVVLFLVTVAQYRLARHMGRLVSKCDRRPYLYASLAVRDH